MYALLYSRVPACLPTYRDETRRDETRQKKRKRKESAAVLYSAPALLYSTLQYLSE